MGLLTDKDSTVFRSWFKEMCKLHGFRVGYQYPLGTTKTIHSEPNMPMSIPIDLDIVFNENPTLDTLRKHGWVTEIGEQKPVVAQVPYDTPNLQRYSRIIIPPVGTIIDARIFEVTAISTILEYPDCWTVRLAPVYKTIQEQNNMTNLNAETIDVVSPGTQDTIPRREEYANYEVPEGKIKKDEGYMVHHSEEPKQELNNVLNKDFNDFDS